MSMSRRRAFLYSFPRGVSRMAFTLARSSRCSVTKSVYLSDLIKYSSGTSAFRAAPEMLRKLQNLKPLRFIAGRRRWKRLRNSRPVIMWVGEEFLPVGVRCQFWYWISGFEPMVKYCRNLVRAVSKLLKEFVILKCLSFGKVRLWIVCEISADW